MSDVVQFPIPAVFDAVVAQFAEDGTSVPNEFGWRAKPRKNNSDARIVWVPGDDLSGDAGKIAAPRSPGIPDRPLATFHEKCTVYIYGVELVSPESQRAQYISARRIFDAWYRALHLAVYGVYAITSVTWAHSRKSVERMRGAAIRVVFSVQARIPDVPYSTVPYDQAADIVEGETGAVVGLEMLDRNEDLSAVLE